MQETAQSSLLCYHCGLPVEDRPIERNEHRFCCQGCAGAYELIAGSGMLDYYEFRTEYAPRPEERSSDEIWDLIENQSRKAERVTSGSAESQPADHRAQTEQSGKHRRNPATENNKAQNNADGENQSAQGSGNNVGATARAESHFLIEGIHCSSCIWLNETMLRSLPGVLEASGNLATNRLHLVWDPDSISLKELAHRIEKLGYRLLPLRKSDSSEAQKNHARSLLKKMVVAGFFAGNIMLVSVSLYAGYFGTMDRFTKNFFHLVSFAFATPVLFYSAAIFFRTAFASLRHGVLSMDLLTSAGLSIAYFYSVYAAFFEAGEVYFDSVCFVTFAVLAGRYLESRLKLRSLYLVDNLQQAESPFARILDNEGNARIIPSEDLKKGDTILLKPGESLPCDSVLLEASAEVEQSLLTGEFEPVTRKKGDLLLSGLKAIGEMKLRVERAGDQSALRQIQAMAAESLNDSPRSQKFAEMAGRYFVGFVLLASIAAFYYHYQKSGLAEAIIITVTLLIVACPCALNLAIPTAFIAGIQRSYSSGILFRNGQHLETIARAKQIIFDKTGTLTTGRMEITEEWFREDFVPPNAGPGNRKDNARPSADLLRSLARSMESRSGIQHPVVRAFQSRYGALPDLELDRSHLRYHPGLGLSIEESASPLILDSRGMSVIETMSRSAAVDGAAAATDELKANAASEHSAESTNRKHELRYEYFLGSFRWMNELASDAGGSDNSRLIRVQPKSQPPSGPDSSRSHWEIDNDRTEESIQDRAALPDIEKLCSERRSTAVVLARRALTETESYPELQYLAVFFLHDALRNDAKPIVSRLAKQYHLTIVSGDSRQHVAGLAEQLGIADFQAQQSPEQKRDFVKQATERSETLMIGDGINDSAALAAADAGISFAGGAGLALLSSDILLLNNRLQDLWKMVLIARSTRAKIIQNLLLAFGYNILLLPIAFAGFISPFLGAVFMSLSSITVIVNSVFAGKVKSLNV